MILPEDIDDFLVLYTEVNGLAEIVTIVGYDAKPTAPTIAASLYEMQEEDREVFQDCYAIQLNRAGVIAIFFPNHNADG